MDTRKMIPVEQLQYSSIFMGEVYRKMSYLPSEDTKVVDYINKSRTIYFVLNQKQWKPNDCSFFLQMSDGREHNRLEMEQPFNNNIECWRFQLEVYYTKDDNGNTQLVITPTKMLITRVAEGSWDAFKHTANEKEYLDNIKAEEEIIINAKQQIKK